MWFLLVLLPGVVQAHRFLLESDKDAFQFASEPLHLPPVFTPGMKVEINGESIALNSIAIPEFLDSETLYYADHARREYAMVSKKKHGIIGTAFRGNHTYNVQANGTLNEIIPDNVERTDLAFWPPGKEKRKQPQIAQVRTIQFDEDNVVRFNPGCWAGDENPRELFVGIATDLSYNMVFGNRTDLILNDIQRIVTNSRLITYVQMNVIITVDLIVIGGDKSPSPLNETAIDYFRSSGDILSSFSRYMRTYQRTPGNRRGSFHLLTNRWPSPGIVGMAYMSSLCLSDWNNGVTSYQGDRTWQIWIHELGHSMGASHSFENGMSRTGGIMDYGNPFYNGVIQFHPFKRPEICGEFQMVLDCPYFKERILVSKCGDKVLGADELCECIDGSTSCAGCRECVPDDPGIECSAETFVYRRPGNSQTMAAATFMLSAPGCCVRKRFVSTKQGRCSESGAFCEFGSCINRCKKFELPSCELINGGCTVPCRMNDYCVPDLKSFNGQEVTKMADGVLCDNGGQCFNGTCLLGPPPPTARPTTARPTDSTEFPTNRSPTSRSPTLEPTYYPTTLSPDTRSPTEEPTPYPTTQSPTTAAPTPDPTTRRPSRRPTRYRNRRTQFPTRVTSSPTPPTNSPTRRPSRPPTDRPTESPTCCACPTGSPTQWNGTYEYY